MHSERNVRLVHAFTALAIASAALAGCGSNYRPVVSSISPVGPAGQPQKYAVAISTVGTTSAGLASIVDFAGDTTLVTTLIGENPTFLQLDVTGSNAFTLNGDGTINSFPAINTLIQSQVDQSTLPAGSNPTSLSSQGPSLYITQPGLGQLAQLASAVPPAIHQELPVGAGITYTITVNQAPRVYGLVANGNTAGQAFPIETSTQTLDNALTVGVNPTYGVMTGDTRRAFVLNKGSNTVTVINSQANAIDNFITHANGTIPVGTAPVWADFAPTLNEVLVANQGNGTSAGSVSVISIDLCSSTTIFPAPNCDPNNPVDASDFGTVVATIPVGINPQQIAVLQDGSQAFVSNQGVLPSAANGFVGTPGSISVINLNTNTVIATIPASDSTDSQDGLVHGHPGFIAATTGTPTGKVYITAPDSHDLTILRTDTDSVQTHVTLQGNGVMVRVTQP